ncbi:hypothetical protein PVAP13_4NG069688 [Panicum virgatum]|uniref:Uncharacterized protein n=1 Tax=Panicum virgatum TaxID=38727 RepID=A0A8T0T9N3_PANVG|nr:hypothetical protein PVAP13_4NG069688 [Panicum virgatum]
MEDAFRSLTWFWKLVAASPNLSRASRRARGGTNHGAAPLPESLQLDGQQEALAQPCLRLHLLLVDHHRPHLYRHALRDEQAEPASHRSQERVLIMGPVAARQPGPALLREQHLRRHRRVHFDGDDVRQTPVTQVEPVHGAPEDDGGAVATIRRPQVELAAVGDGADGAPPLAVRGPERHGLDVQLLVGDNQLEGAVVSDGEKGWRVPQPYPHGRETVGVPGQGVADAQHGAIPVAASGMQQGEEAVARGQGLELRQEAAALCIIN